MKGALRSQIRIAVLLLEFCFAKLHAWNQAGAGQGLAPEEGVKTVGQECGVGNVVAATSSFLYVLPWEKGLVT
jgi:hypothetical protein